MENEIDLIKIIRISANRVKKHWFVLLLLFIVPMALSFAFYKSKKKVYSSTAVLYIKSTDISSIVVQQLIANLQNEVVLGNNKAVEASFGIDNPELIEDFVGIESELMASGQTLFVKILVSDKNIVDTLEPLILNYLNSNKELKATIQDKSIKYNKLIEFINKEQLRMDSNTMFYNDKFNLGDFYRAKIELEETKKSNEFMQNTLVNPIIYLAPFQKENIFHESPKLKNYIFSGFLVSLLCILIFMIWAEIAKS